MIRARSDSASTLPNSVSHKLPLFDCHSSPVRWYSYPVCLQLGFPICLCFQFTDKLYSGKCNHIDTCPYSHDRTRVAICRPFLYGRCTRGAECLLSHDMTPERMPTCAFFLEGNCSRDDCPYPHVNVGASAQMCPHFERGSVFDLVRCNSHLLTAPPEAGLSVCIRRWCFQSRPRFDPPLLC